VFYKRDIDEDWTYQDTYITADSLYFIAPLSGIFQLKFTGSSVSVDDFVGFQKPMPWAALQDVSETDGVNAEVIEHFKGQKVNVAYDRVLSAGKNADGTFAPKAYTLCLPYDFRFGELIEPGKVKFYQLSFIDDYRKQFVFTAVTDVAEAGKAYLVVVDYGEVSLNAYNVELRAEPVDDIELTAVNDYDDWYFEGNKTKVGQWAGNFSSISATEADNKNLFCLLSDGTWTRFTSEDNPEARLNAFRGYYLSDAPTDPPAGARGQGVVDKDVNRFQTLFMGSMSDGSIPGVLDIHYDADIPVPFILGDANGDGKLTEADVKAIADHVMGHDPENFSERNADVNGDEKIDAADIVELVNWIK
jgi:hypothetical protein